MRTLNEPCPHGQPRSQCNVSQATETSRFSLRLGETNCPEDEVALLSGMFYAFLSTKVFFLVLRKVCLFQEMFLKNIINKNSKL